MDFTEVILVDENDRPVGTAEKIEAHEKGLLHRAFSVFIFNQQGEMLLQQRAIEKYHSGGLWTNACCSHPLPGEVTISAAKRRLKEELGIIVSITKVFEFSYQAVFDNGLTENEFDHVFVGIYEGIVDYNREEVMEISFQNIQQLRASLRTHPENYTPWFHIAFPKIEDWWKRRFFQQTA